MENNNIKKIKRTKKEIDRAVSDAIKKLVKINGFDHITVNALIKEAQIDPNMFYRKYGTIELLLASFIRDYDFWLIDELKTSDIQKIGAKKFYAKTLKLLFNELLDNDVMQKLLVWELSDSNPTTRKTASMREKLNLNVLIFYDDVFKGTGINIKAFTSLLISGIYYLVLHREISSFCTINIKSLNHRTQLLKTIDLIVDMLFERANYERNRNDMIFKMLKDGVSTKKICEYTNISMADLRKIVKNNKRSIEL